MKAKTFTNQELAASVGGVWYAAFTRGGLGILFWSPNALNRPDKLTEAVRHAGADSYNTDDFKSVRRVS